MIVSKELTGALLTASPGPCTVEAVWIVPSLTLAWNLATEVPEMSENWYVGSATPPPAVTAMTAAWQEVKTRAVRKTRRSIGRANADARAPRPSIDTAPYGASTTLYISQRRAVLAGDL